MRTYQRIHVKKLGFYKFNHSYYKQKFNEKFSSRGCNCMFILGILRNWPISEYDAPKVFTVCMTTCICNLEN